MKSEEIARHGYVSGTVQGVAFRYYPDGKSFFPGGKPATELHRRTFLTLVGLLSGRIELGTSFSRLTDEIRHDLTRLYPMLPNGKAFRPADFLIGRKHPEVYVYKVDDQWAQVILVNADEVTATRPMLRNRQAASSRIVAAPVAGDQAELGSLGLRADKRYHVFDFWNQEPLGILEGDEELAVHLKLGEARVYAVREVEAHPQILGTNRHVMCGMMEISATGWDAGAATLSFTADLVGGETMDITIALPEDGRFTPRAVSSDSAEVSFKQEGNHLKVSARTSNNRQSRIKLEFQPSN